MSKLRESARGKPCAVRIDPALCGFPETTVLAHLPGGGMAAKTPDTCAVYACRQCHDLMDRRDGRWRQYGAELINERIIRALVETHRMMVADGLL